MRFKDKMAIGKKRLRARAPPEYKVTITMSKVRREVIEKWVSKRLVELMDGIEDEVLEGMVLGLLQTEVSRLARGCTPPRWCAAVRHHSGRLRGRAVHLHGRKR